VVNHYIRLFVSGCLVIDPGDLTFDDHPNGINPDVRFVEFDRDSQSWVFSGTIEDILDRDVVKIFVNEDVEVSFSGENGSGFLGEQPSIIANGKYLLTRGVWYLQMNGGPEFESGNCTITLSTDGYEPPDYVTLPVAPIGRTPIVITFGVEGDDTSGSVSGRTDNVVDMQWFQFEVQERSRLSVNTDFTGKVHLLRLTGEIIADSIDAQILTELPKGLYNLRLTDPAAVGDFPLSVALDSIFVDPVAISELPEHSLNAKPEFKWDAQGAGGEYEIFIGERRLSACSCKIRHCGPQDSTLRTSKCLL
jgi:hypothetical protein